MNPNDILLVTSGYLVIAVAKSDGSTLWETELVKRFFKPTSPFVTLLVDESGVYAHTINEIFRLDLMTGNILWKQELPTSSWFRNSNIASLATLEQSIAPVGPAAQARAEARRNSGDGGGAA